MAALGAITVVVEAAQPSGSLITARQALGLDREVGAVPGPVTSRVSEGTNDLIVDGAGLIRGAQDVLDRLLGVGIEAVRRSGPPLEPDLARVAEAVELGSGTCDAVAVALGVAAAARRRSRSPASSCSAIVRTDAAGRYAQERR